VCGGGGWSWLAAAAWQPPTCNAVFFTSSASWNMRIISSILSMCTYSPTNAVGLPDGPPSLPPLLTEACERLPLTLKSDPLLPSALVLGRTYVGNPGARRAWRELSGCWLLLLPPRGAA
jgi:hypothetical protein